MERIGAECLCCGQRRIVERGTLRLAGSTECPRCGYLGWAPAADLDESTRRALRSRPPERRRLFAVA